MSRLTNEQLTDWALPYSTRNKGDCAGVTKLLLDVGFGNYVGDPPTERRKKAVRIPLREKTSHTSVLLRWAHTGEEVIVDATIQQFGGERRVFVGSYDEWVACLKALTHVDHVEPVDADYGFMYDVLDTLDTLDKDDLRRSTGGTSSEAHRAETLNKKGCCNCTLL
ncbi:MAG: hypothetical protein WBG81_11225 [Rhodanobacter sp.]|jgi:hypothetical protein|uniref:hypothetical protein n=1 Tax=Rhodanobacter sp. KK11 TaxID=3083255 RepID=UPI0029670A7E|nr:hypothetical protein [Rhodanobacter sp. KK11]MDW2981453.1 hypothetical protein [Rhodanobacter sp. KK11]